MNKKHHDDESLLRIILWIVLSILLFLVGMSFGYYFGYEKGKEEIIRIEKSKEQKRLSLLEKIESTSVAAPDTVNTRLKKVLEKESKKQKKIEAAVQSFKEINESELEQAKQEILQEKSHITASHEYEAEPTKEPPKRIARKTKRVSSGKPKLAIIIDDVSVKSHVNAIKSLGLHLTMSFLPPSKFRPNSAKLAAKEEFYMVHLPLEAKNFNAEEPSTLRINDSQKVVTQKIENIKKMFPKVRYINNHTGSSFTANEIAMNKLILSLNSNDISFIDSRTTSKTKVPKVMRNFGLKYVARDVFLDHEMDKEYIKGQIQKVVQIAKAEGVAIAIGHPHSNTILALHESKKLLDQVELVYVNEIY